MATTMLGLLSSPADHAVVLSAVKSSIIPSSSSSSSSSCPCSSLSMQFQPRRIAGFTTRRRRAIACEVAIKSDAAGTASEEDSPPSSSSPAAEDETGGGRIGARVRVTVPLKVYHVAKAPEIDLTGMEGTLKQYVGVWKGKKISANFPFKVEFRTEVEGRGAVKFFAHLRDDEFEYV